MKNITVAIDEETHRKARIRAAELGTSVSALVKAYLQTLADDPSPQLAGVREMPTSFAHASAEKPAGPPYLVDGKWVYTKDGKPRRPGALRGKYEPVDPSDLETPDWLIDIMEGSEDDFSDLLPFDDAQLSPK